MLHSQDVRGRLSQRSLSGFSHSVRNHLNAVALTLFNIEGILSGADFPERPTVVNQLRMASGEVEKIGKVLAGFVDLLRPRPPKLAPVAIDAVTRRAIELAQSRLEAQGSQAAAVTVEGGSATVLADEEQLTDALAAVLQNSLEALPEDGGAVTVVIEVLDDRRLLLEVHDEGEEEMSDLVLEHCFDAFFTTKAGRLGLGLTRARQVLEAHGGEVEIAANEPRGSIISIRLPLQQA